jgi:DNA-binding NtrC family response regulator
VFDDTERVKSTGSSRKGRLTVVVSWASGTFCQTLDEKLDSALIGRSKSCTVVVSDPSVSRRHARIRFGVPSTIEDLGSANGTRVQGRRIQAHVPTEIPEGTVVSVGHATLLLQGQPSSTRLVKQPPSTAEGAPESSTLVVQDPVMQEIHRLLDVLGPSELSVLILGETGVGKEVFARELHRRSSRRNGPFVALNCGALPESIIESELFGHEKGAFTGAGAHKIGLFESARGGTIFLDEIGDLPMSVQTKLLRVLETGEMMALGSVAPHFADVRLLAATNRDLEGLVVDGRFRKDLLFRINGFSLTLPPLCDRRDDIIPLAKHFLALAATRHRRSPPTLTVRALHALVEHDWPGNIRELRHVIERSLVLCPRDELDVADVLIGATPSDGLARASASTVAQNNNASAEGLLTKEKRLHEQMARHERQHIIDALRGAAGNQSKAARVLGVSRTTLVNKIKVYGIDLPSRRRSTP